MTPINTGIATAITAFTFYAIAMNVATPGWYSWYEMSMNGQMTEATITKVQPEVHQNCYFRYEVKGKQYDGFSSGCSHLSIGQEMSVMYLPNNPSVVTTKEPKGELFFMVLAPLLLSSVAGVIVGVRHSKASARDLT